MNEGMMTSPRTTGGTVAFVSAQPDGMWVATWSDETPELPMSEDHGSLDGAKRYVEREWGTLQWEQRGADWAAYEVRSQRRSGPHFPS